MGFLQPAQAQGFAAYVSPPRFELTVKAGERQREIIQIQHMGEKATQYKVYTNDWKLNPDGSVQFLDALQPGSCREWVALEAKQITLAARGQMRYRFEITPPADAPAQECRFAIMIEGTETRTTDAQGVKIPVGGRIGVIVYASVGNAAPVLQVVGHKVITQGGAALPAIEVRNTGTAHGRYEGVLDSTDGAGRKAELVPNNAPILPGTSRWIALLPNVPEGQATPTLQYPLDVKGTLEWGNGRTKLEHRFTR